MSNSIYYIISCQPVRSLVPWSLPYWLSISGYATPRSSYPLVNIVDCHFVCSCILSSVLLLWIPVSIGQVSQETEILLAQPICYCCVLMSV